MGSALDGAVAATFATLSRIRGRRIFHPQGVAFAANLEPGPDAPPAFEFLAGGRRPAIVRLSRGAGLPEPVPDVLGLAIRIPDAYGPDRHQDLLLVTSAGPPGARHLLLPARGFADLPYSSVLPYRERGRLLVFGARATGTARPGPGLARLREQTRTDLRFQLTCATIAGGWADLGEVELEEKLTDEESESLRFNPGNSGGGLEPAGFLNDLRMPAYAASQLGRGAGEAEDAATSRGAARRNGASPDGYPASAYAGSARSKSV